MKPERALIFLSVTLLFATIVMGGLYLSKSDFANGISLLYYATYTFVGAMCFLIFAEMVHLTKRHMSNG